MKISFEGIPGSGKTTLLKILEEMGYNCYMGGEHNLSHREINLKLVESSPYVLKQFLVHLASDYQIYPKSKDDAFLLKDWTPDFIIYLDCQPDIASKRIQKSETLLSGLYITELYLQLDSILHPVNCDIPVFKVNASGSIFHTLHHVLAILQFIQDTDNT